MESVAWMRASNKNYRSGDDLCPGTRRLGIHVCLHEHGWHDPDPFSPTPAGSGQPLPNITSRVTVHFDALDVCAVLKKIANRLHEQGTPCCNLELHEEFN